MVQTVRVYEVTGAGPVSLCRRTETNPIRNSFSCLCTSLNGEEFIRTNDFLLFFKLKCV